MFSKSDNICIFERFTLPQLRGRVALNHLNSVSYCQAYLPFCSVTSVETFLHINQCFQPNACLSLCYPTPHLWCWLKVEKATAMDSQDQAERSWAAFGPNPVAQTNTLWLCRRVSLVERFLFKFCMTRDWMPSREQEMQSKTTFQGFCFVNRNASQEKIPILLFSSAGHCAQ